MEFLVIGQLLTPNLPAFSTPELMEESHYEIIFLKPCFRLSLMTEVLCTLIMPRVRLNNVILQYLTVFDLKEPSEMVQSDNNIKCRSLSSVFSDFKRDLEKFLRNL